MPTANPRIQVTLPPSQHELLRRLAELQGRSMSAILAELFEQVYPVLERVAVVLQAAARAQDSMKEGLRESTAQAERDLRPLLASAFGQLDLLQMEFEAADTGLPTGRAAQRSGAAERSAAAVQDPRVVTRGSGLAGGKHKRSKSAKRGSGRAISRKPRVASHKGGKS